MAEFYKGTLDTLMERLCSSISSFDQEWVKRCVPATEEQIQQLQDILAEYHYTIPAAYLYYLRRMGQDDGGLLENQWDGCEVDIGSVLKLLFDKVGSYGRKHLYARKHLEEGLFLFSDNRTDACFYMKLSIEEDNPMVTDIENTYVAESFEKYLFQKAFHMYQEGFAHSDFESSSVCHEKKDKEDCRTCPFYGDTVEGRMDFINQMAESYGLKKAWFSDLAHFICYNSYYAFEISVCDGYSIKFSCNDNKLWKQVRYSLSLFPEFFMYLSKYESCENQYGRYIHFDTTENEDSKLYQKGEDLYERYAHFNRYGDISKFITDPDLLQVTWDKYVYISNENDYDIAVGLESCYAPFDEVKPFIAFLATQICELDNIVQRFNQKKRIKNGGRGYVCLPSSVGILRIDYSQSMEDNPTPQEEKFSFILACIYIEEKNWVSFDYWCTTENSQLDVIFEYKENKFFLRRYGIIDCIPDNWEEK